MIQQLIPLICIFIIAYATVSPAEPLPGLDPHSEKLTHQLHRAMLAKGEDYLPRTRHLSAAGRGHGRAFRAAVRPRSRREGDGGGPRARLARRRAPTLVRSRTDSRHRGVAGDQEPQRRSDRLHDPRRGHRATPRASRPDPGRAHQLEENER